MFSVWSEVMLKLLEPVRPIADGYMWGNAPHPALIASDGCCLTHVPGFWIPRDECDSRRALLDCPFP